MIYWIFDKSIKYSSPQASTQLQCQPVFLTSPHHKQKMKIDVIASFLLFAALLPFTLGLPSQNEVSMQPRANESPREHIVDIPEMDEPETTGDIQLCTLPFEIQNQDVSLEDSPAPESQGEALECSICQEALPDDFEYESAFQCSHVYFHEECLIKWVKQCTENEQNLDASSCPICRAIGREDVIERLLTPKVNKKKALIIVCAVAACIGLQTGLLLGRAWKI